ncbi:MAG: efflux RND transporter periplasmic adaptor subunit [Terriglobia bacterium]|nr:MAG: efflux RND transporter periplasmic adaptor subunit [Terriglobia bacterium]
MTKRTVVLAASGAALVVGLGAWGAFRRSGAGQFRTVPVECGDIAYTVSATGAPNAVVTVLVGSQVSGNIQALYADFNTKVHKDEVVARIDPQIFQARVDQARATLNVAQTAVINAQAVIEKSHADVSSAQASVANAKANVVRYQSAVTDAKTKLARRAQLVSEGVLSREDGDTAQATYDQAVANLDAAQAQVTASQGSVSAAQAQVRVAETQLASAKAQVDQAQAALAQAQADLDHTFIRAPVDGVVVSRNIDVGQTVAASLQAPTLFSIAQDLTKMQVDTNVSEADVGRVRVGMPATFTVDAYPGQVFHGSVSAIRKAAINVQNVVTYDVVLAVSNPDLKLFPGMTANVKILVDQHTNVLKIPNAALRYRPADTVSKTKVRDGSKEVWILDEESKPKPVHISLGLSDGAYTEVTRGDLKEGDRVIVASFSKKEANGSSGSPFSGGRPGMGGGRGGF